MKKAVLLLVFITLTSFVDTADNVYICNSKGAKKYHLKEFCRGLSACKHEVIKVTLKEAKEKGLDLCGWED
ncbi:hypothetical protein IVB69_11685 [Flavobacterium sp. J49]|uniref:hypothetical protein n=1 Tax=Flavobacterium sp. J49 TaxID=2718534 RepID=UPI001594A29F|nr:hypothetical protein [Flavobacterium sp. J49]MBF6642144.1 hypothetical protein [Flavobacterium sp. J49]NIC03391.1 hypothetical protein [Flavobacterium sp. J49]